jgi:hypothetical protein
LSVLSAFRVNRDRLRWPFQGAKVAAVPVAGASPAGVVSAGE